MRIDKQITCPNFTTGRRSFKPEAIVIHIMEGTLDGTDSWFATRTSKVSAHFGIGKNGELHQYVDVANTAWHAGRVNKPTWLGIKAKRDGGFFNPNYYTIGIEHEGFGLTEWSEAMYHKSADLIANLCLEYHIPLDRAHIVGHHEIYSIKSCPGRKVNFNILIGLARQYRDKLINPDSPVPEITTINPLDFIASSGTVKAVKNLNIREQSPSTSSKIASLAQSNTALPYVGWVTNGQPINGNRKWYKDSNGNFFWSGATT